MTNKYAPVFENAAALIEGGWTQGTFTKEEDGVVCYCIRGAFEASFGGANPDNRLRYLEYMDTFMKKGGYSNDNIVEASDLLHRALSIVDKNAGSLTWFNDNRAKDKAQVVQVLKTAATL